MRPFRRDVRRSTNLGCEQRGLSRKMSWAALGRPVLGSLQGSGLKWLINVTKVQGNSEDNVMSMEYKKESGYS